eukprot:COSAG01_NODE_341_length_18611_cov_31.251513_23_plen_24_part_01
MATYSYLQLYRYVGTVLVATAAVA